VCNIVFGIGILVTQMAEEKIGKGNKEDSIESVGAQANPIEINDDPQTFGIAEEEVKEEKC